jgi:heme exporter protein C
MSVLFQLAAPKRFDALAAAALPWLWLVALALTIAGMYVGFVVAPTDATQGEAYRIIYIHVPAAWLSMVLYVAMAFWAVTGWVFKTRMASMFARAIAPTGALFTVLALVSGALWGQPTWGTWWVWDARLTSELLLLFLYFGFMALTASMEDNATRADAAGALLALVGTVNVPVIYFSVRWWNTLHQGASVSLTAAPKMAEAMLLGMLLMSLACWVYALAVVLLRCRALICEQESDRHWLQSLHAPVAQELST